jgi:four helix bundle protein
MKIAGEHAASARTFDLEERTIAFAKNVRMFVQTLPRTLANIEDSKQLIRSSGSIAANYAEADEAVSTKDFILRLRICRKESKESRIHLRLVDVQENETLEKERHTLLREAKELLLIFAAIIRKNEEWCLGFAPWSLVIPCLSAVAFAKAE